MCLLTYGKLVSCLLKTLATNLYVAAMMTEDVWIGLSDRQEEGTFVWKNNVTAVRIARLS